MTSPTLLYDRVSNNAITVHVDVLMSSRLLVQANSGGGKSRALRSLLEQTHGKVQHIIIDPEGEFATLREKFSYVLAGKDADVPAHPKVAKVLCRRLIELGASAVVDIFELSKQERREFVKLFLLELMALPRSLWKPVIVVIDEAHEFCPQTGESQSTDAVIALCTQGRKRGFCAVLATQRISKLHKDAAAELNNKLIGRTGLDVDQKRAGDDLGFDKEQRLALRDMAPGHFWSFGPAMGNGVQLVQTAPVTTTHPDSRTIGAIAPPANATVQSLVAQIGDLPAWATKDADEKAALEAKVRELLAQLRAKPQPAAANVSETEIVEREKAAFNRGSESMRVAAEQLVVKALERGRADAIGQMESLLMAMRIQPLEVTDIPLPTPNVSLPSIPSERRQRLAKSFVETPAVSPKSSDSSLSSTQLKMLNAMAAMERIGIDPQTRAQIAGWIGVSFDTGTFRNNLTALRNAGTILDLSVSELRLTDEGRKVANADNVPIRSLHELHETVLGKLGSTPAKMLDVLLEAYPKGVTRQDVAAALGVSHDTGTFRNNLTTLRTYKFMTDVDKSTLRASSWLFPEGLS